MTFVFEIKQSTPISYTETVVVTIASGNPGEGFTEHMEESLREWWDGAEVTTQQVIE